MTELVPDAEPSHGLTSPEANPRLAAAAQEIMDDFNRVAAATLNGSLTYDEQQAQERVELAREGVVDAASDPQVGAVKQEVVLAYDVLAKLEGGAQMPLTYDEQRLVDELLRSRTIPADWTGGRVPELLKLRDAMTDYDKR
jgi:hypothetical protein